jgi:hypothetical protein
VCTLDRYEWAAFLWLIVQRARQLLMISTPKLQQHIAKIVRWSSIYAKECVGK